MLQVNTSAWPSTSVSRLSCGSGRVPAADFSSAASGGLSYDFRRLATAGLNQISNKSNFRVCLPDLPTSLFLLSWARATRSEVPCAAIGGGQGESTTTSSLGLSRPPAFATMSTAVDKHMLKELLLVCSALGSVATSEPRDGDSEKPVGQHQRFVRGENCLEWLQDLQRWVVPSSVIAPGLSLSTVSKLAVYSPDLNCPSPARARNPLSAMYPHLLLLSRHCRALRRDDDNTREICITISSWRVVQHKLVPLILECRDDAVLVNTLFKIYVMLTMPLSKQAEEALLKPINPKAQGDLRDQQTRRRENAISQQVRGLSMRAVWHFADFVAFIEESLWW